MSFILLLIIFIIIYVYLIYYKNENYKNIEISNFDGNNILYNLIKSNKIFSVARNGVGTEFIFAFNFTRNANIAVPIKLHQEAGIYFSKTSNSNNEKQQFSNLYLNAIKNCNYLASWYNKPNIYQREQFFINKYKIKHFPAEILDVRYMDEKKPWTYALKNKVVLVIHPFNKLIEYQYKNKRKVLFKNKKILPKFKLKTIEPPNTAGFTKLGENWYKNFVNLCNKIDKIDFDIALVSCGGYGHPIIDYIKMKKKGVQYTLEDVYNYYLE